MNFECFIVWIQQTIYNTYAAIIITEMWGAIMKADLSRRLQAKRKKNLLIEWIWSRFIDVFHALSVAMIRMTFLIAPANCSAMFV